MRAAVWLLGMLAVVASAASAQGQAFDALSPEPELELVAEFPSRQVTGVTVSQDGRVFVCFPYWSQERYNGAVAEVLPDGSVRPYPDDSWNAWRLTSTLDPRSHFVCVQSVVVDDAGRLWVLDPGAPLMERVITGAPKLVEINLSNNRVERVIAFSPDIAPAGSYLNDVRIDVERGYAYITDSGLGALVVVDLARGQAKRVLENHPSTQAEDVTPVIGGQPLRTSDGRTPRIHADGIALSPDGENLYYHALTGYRLYRVPTQALRLLDDQPDLLAAAVEDLGPDVISDGIFMDPQRNLYLTALELDAVVKRSPRDDMEIVVQDERLRWPDTLALGPEGWLYVTVSQIHLTERFNQGQSAVTQPWAVYKMRLPGEAMIDGGGDR